MRQPYRRSPYIDFNTGAVLSVPDRFFDSVSKANAGKPLDVMQRIDQFHCRVDVWQLGVAAEMVRQIEDNTKPKDSIWHHSAFQLVTILASYFEVVGKIVSPNARTRCTSSNDFNRGFCEVYRSSQLTQPLPAGHAQDFKDETIPAVADIRNLMRNGMYHLGFTKKNFFLHDNQAELTDDFTLQIVTDNESTSIGAVYLLNPHNLTRTVINHFGSFIDRLKAPEETELRDGFTRFETFSDAELSVMRSN